MAKKTLNGDQDNTLSDALAQAVAAQQAIHELNKALDGTRVAGVDTRPIDDVVLELIRKTTG